MSRKRRGRPRSVDVALVEFSGHGGIHEHAVVLARLLSNRGHRVVVHSRNGAAAHVGAAEFRELRPLRNVQNNRVARLRYLAVLLGVTLPRLLAELRRARVVHLHGQSNPVLTASVLLAARLWRCRVIYSPHNTFVRSGSTIAQRVLQTLIRLPDEVIVYSAADSATLSAKNISSTVCELIHDIEMPAANSVRAWKQRLGPSPIVLMPGFIRHDKNPGLFVEAVAPLGVSAWIVGEDHGAAAEASAAVARVDHRVGLLEGHFDHESFVALLAAADVIVCPYAVASQSGILSIARHLGITTVASQVGGLPEWASLTFDPLDAPALRSAISRVLAAPEAYRPAPTPSSEAAIRAFERVYNTRHVDR